MASVRLYLAGLGDRLCAVVYRLAAASSRWARARTLTPSSVSHHHDYRHPDRGEDLQLVVHHVSGAVLSSIHVMWTIGFIVTLLGRRYDGVLLAVPGADFVLHNSLF